jgi:hypothetical protein
MIRYNAEMFTTGEKQNEKRNRTHGCKPQTLHHISPGLLRPSTHRTDLHHSIPKQEHFKARTSQTKAHPKGEAGAIIFRLLSIDRIFLEVPDPNPMTSPCGSIPTPSPHFEASPT